MRKERYYIIKKLGSSSDKKGKILYSTKIKEVPIRKERYYIIKEGVPIREGR